MNPTRIPKLPLFVLLFVLAACRASATTAPTVATPVPTVATPATAAAPASVAPVTTTSQAPTTTSSKTFKLPVSFSTGAAWYIAEDYADVVTLVSDQYPVDLAIIIVKDAKIADPQDAFSKVAFPDDFLAWIQAHELFPSVTTQPVVVAGFPGTQIDSIVTEDCGSKTDWLFLSGTGWNCRKGEHYRFITLDDVYGQRVLIMNTGGSASEEDFNQGAEAAQKVLNTVTFSKP